MKHFKSKFKLLIFFISIVNAAHAISPEKIIEAKKKGTLLITLRDPKQKFKYIGSGFFTDNKGHFITNFHVIEDYIEHPKDFNIQFQTSDGEEFKDVTIEKCRNKNNIDLCYGKINTEKKILYFDVQSKSPSRSQPVVFIGHSNQDYFGVKNAEVASLENNIEEKYGVPFLERENRDTSMIEIGKYKCKNDKCKGDSGGPVFDPFTGDLLGVMCSNFGNKNHEKKIYAIDTKEVYSFINSESTFQKFNIPKEHFYQKEKKPDIGQEFEIERKTGKLEK